MRAPARVVREEPHTASLRKWPDLVFGGIVVYGHFTVLQMQHQLASAASAASIAASTTADEFHRRALGAPSFFECHRIEILSVTPDLSFPNIPYMGVWNIGAFARCAVNASKTAQRDDS
jgi:hypothetical protein